jgi:hypothetical protein
MLHAPPPSPSAWGRSRLRRCRGVLHSQQHDVSVLIPVLDVFSDIAVLICTRSTRFRERISQFAKQLLYEQF